MTYEKFLESIVIDEPFYWGYLSRHMRFVYRLNNEIILIENVFNISEKPPKTPAQFYYLLSSHQTQESNFWGGVTYTDYNLARNDLKEFVAKEICEEFYCDKDNPAWFLIFDNEDKALRYTYHNLLVNRLNHEH